MDADGVATLHYPPKGLCRLTKPGWRDCRSDQWAGPKCRPGEGLVP